MRNEYKINGEITSLYCNYKDTVYEVLIDTEMIDKLKQIDVNWRIKPVNNHFIVTASQYLGKTDGKEINKTLQLNRIILNCDASQRIVYLNGNRLDNRYENLTCNTGFTIEKDGKKIKARKCIKCKEIKPNSEYSKSRTECKDCDKKAHKERYQANKDIWKSNSSEYKKNYYKKYYKLNKEKYIINSKKQYINNREYYKRKQLIYYARNKDKYRISELKRKTLKSLLPFQFLEKDRQKVLKDFNSLCSFSNNKDSIHLDHFIPLSIGHGGTYIGNILPLFSELNLSKNNNNPFEWIETRDDIDINKFNKVVDYLARQNNLTPEEYKNFVYWCFDNPRTIEQIKADGDKTSLELWKESSHEKYMAEQDKEWVHI